jgi:hypothetical protein
VPPCLTIKPRVCFQNNSLKVKVLGGGFNLWLGDNILILSMVKQAPSYIVHYFLTFTTSTKFYHYCLLKSLLQRLLGEAKGFTPS